MTGGSAAVQRRRGTASDTAAFTGLAGEFTVDTTNNRLIVHDGATAGGHPAARLDELPAAGALKACTVATLPAVAVGSLIYVSNGRKIGEAAGAGTGVVAYGSNSAWRRLSDDNAVAA